MPAKSDENTKSVEKRAITGDENRRSMSALKDRRSLLSLKLIKLKLDRGDGTMEKKIKSQALRAHVLGYG